MSWVVVPIKIGMLKDLTTKSEFQSFNLFANTNKVGEMDQIPKNL